MKTIQISILAFTGFLVAACSKKEPNPSAPTDGEIIESAIIWDANLDSRWVPVEMERLLADTSKFTKEGNFYKVEKPILVFGHPAKYVSMVGVELLAGPNAALDGAPRDVAKHIIAEHGIELEEVNGAYACEIKKDVTLIVFPHPVIDGDSIVIGSYTGP